MDMIEDGALTTPCLAYSPELFFRFQCYWPIVYDRQQNRPDMRLSFHALGGDRDQLWTRHTEDRALSRSKETTRLCHAPIGSDSPGIVSIASQGRRVAVLEAREQGHS